jgi:hypothetical protein
MKFNYEMKGYPVMDTGVDSKTGVGVCSQKGCYKILTFPDNFGIQHLGRHSDFAIAKMKEVTDHYRKKHPKIFTYLEITDQEVCTSGKKAEFHNPLHDKIMIGITIFYLTLLVFYIILMIAS